ncbi:hypothetical protein C8241_04095 [Paracidovorax avenae]|nr:hypothetical protein C8241_04095 [Paracidovorax avenae]
MKHPPERLRRIPPLSPCCARRAGGRRRWPGKAGSTASAGVACSAAIGWVRPYQVHRPHAVAPIVKIWCCGWHWDGQRRQTDEACSKAIEMVQMLRTRASDLTALTLDC